MICVFTAQVGGNVLLKYLNLTVSYHSETFQLLFKILKIKSCDISRQTKFMTFTCTRICNAFIFSISVLQKNRYVLHVKIKHTEEISLLFFSAFKSLQGTAVTHSTHKHEQLGPTLLICSYISTHEFSKPEKVFNSKLQRNRKYL